MKRLVTFLLLLSTINLLWFPITDGVHETLHAIKSRIHDHGHHHNHSNKNHHHSSHRVEEHNTIKSLLNVFASIDDQKQSLTVILFLFFSIEVIYFFLSSFIEKLSLIPESQKYNLHITPPTPPPLE